MHRNCFIPQSIGGTLALGVAAAALMVGCTAPPKPKGSAGHDKDDHQAGAKTGADAKADGESDDAAKAQGGGGSSQRGENGDDKNSPTKECCLYCVDGAPCGDKCVTAEQAESCGEPAGCACPGSERKAPTFREGDRALQGMIAADVPAYNKAQGDPVDGFFTLDDAFEGDADLADTGKGTLYARFVTTMGDFECELFEKQAPITVANFVGLARGVRPYKDPETKTWGKNPFFEGILFHRVIDGFMIQTGDPTGTGTGNPGYFIPDEFDGSLRHVGPGVLSMANRNRVDPRTQKLRTDPKTGQTVGNTGSSQFFVTVAAAPHLDGRHAIFGRCADASVPKKISKVDTVTNRALGMDHKPREDVSVKKVEVYRK